ncbi:hypothetical protein [Sphingomonas sp. 8AM]|uniref:hypothetical protein n=1 Tax=Sphingomonas sp. 8AM TaxID=2653170 RepID=UPI001358F9CF|nr:hypothetical protein [Sphingomonas sp. 8AM]
MARIDPASVTTRSSLQKPLPVSKTTQRTTQEAAPAGASGCALTSQYGGDKQQSIDLDCYRFATSDPDTAYDMATSDRFLEQQRQDARNRLQSVLLNQANFACQLEKGRLYANRATLDAAFDFMSAGFSAASTIVGGDLAKSILSGVAGLSTATRSNINANIYQNQIIPAITLVMDAARKEALIDLRAKSRQNIAEYTADEMILLANEYHQSCSFERGVQLLLNAALNKEGADAIVRGINLRAKAVALKDQIADQLVLKNRLEKQQLDASSVQANVDALQARLQEVNLKLSENAQGVDPITTFDKASGGTR